MLRIIRRAKEERFLLRVYRSALFPPHFSADLMEERREKGGKIEGTMAEVVF